MPQDYVFMTDSDSDLPYDIADARGIQVVKMPYAIDGREYMDDNGRTNDPHEFFQKMRQGAAPVTSLLPTQSYLELFEPILKEKDILFIAFSSNMSGTQKNAKEARDILLKKYPERKLKIVDTLLISGPMSLLVMRAHDLYMQGASMDEVEQYVLDRRFHFLTWMTVDDLKYLKRGGRISPTKAFFGSMLDIKPLITMGKNGLMVNVGQVQGRKKALKTVIDKVVENIEEPENQEVLILHADMADDAGRVRDTLMQRIPGLRSVRLQAIGPVIGAHCGPGTIAVCFEGKLNPVET